MGDLISRQSAINAIENTDVELSSKEWDELAGAIMDVPSAEPEIVRCKDCIHKPLWEDGGVRFPDDDCPCYCPDIYYSWIPEDDWFCGNGKRAEE